MAAIKNRYSFLQAVDGTFVLYDDRAPIIDQIQDCTITRTSYTDSQGTTIYSYQFFDNELYQYYSTVISKYDARKKTLRQTSSRSRDSIDVNQDETEKKAVLDSAVQASQQQATSQSPQLQTVREGYGETPDRLKVDSLTNNVKEYGGDISALVYPSDLITNQTGYNGCYTVFFISEHPGSSIANVESFKAPTKYVPTVEGGAIATTMPNVNDDHYKSLTSLAAGGGAAYLFGRAVAKAISGYEALKSNSSGFSPMGQLLGSLAAGVVAVGAGGVTKSLTEAFADKITVLQNNTNYRQLAVTIALPTPRIEDKHTLKWDGSKGAAIGGGILQMLSGLNGIEGIDAGKLFSLDGINEIKRFANQQNKRGESLGDAAATNIGGALDALALKTLGNQNSEFGTTIAALSGKAVNPRKEQLFDDVEFRTFTMSFDLAARNVSDMKNIESIIRIFKYHAYPELTPGNFMWIYPAHFDIVHYYRNGVNYHMPRHATSVLTNIDVDYAGGQSFISVHHDGSPVMMKLTLTFVEIAVLSRDSIKKGY